MNERLIDIIIWVMAQLNSNSIEQADIYSLIEQGYTDKEISTAVSWITDKAESMPFSGTHKLQKKDKHVYRFLSSEEKDLFTKDALAKIQQLQALGLITNEHLDMMIYRAFLFGIREINADMVKQYIAIFMFDAPSAEYMGSRTILHNGDSIN